MLATSATRTVIDLAGRTSFEAALVAAESALNKGLTTLAELDEVLGYCVDWPGPRNAGLAADDQNSALALARLREQPVERFALTCPVEESGRRGGAHLDEER